MVRIHQGAYLKDSSSTGFLVVSRALCADAKAPSPGPAGGPELQTADPLNALTGIRWQRPERARQKGRLGPFPRLAGIPLSGPESRPTAVPDRPHQLPGLVMSHSTGSQD